MSITSIPCVEGSPSVCGHPPVADVAALRLDASAFIHHGGIIAVTLSSRCKQYLELPVIWCLETEPHPGLPSLGALICYLIFAMGFCS